jgi:predicted HicB family RNase H-like nuclease
MISPEKRPHSQCMTLRISTAMHDELTNEAISNHKSLSRNINDNICEAFDLLFRAIEEAKSA